MNLLHEVKLQLTSYRNFSMKQHAERIDATR
jgi:hypothetical protein